MQRYFLLIILILLGTFLFGHDLTNDFIKWKRYFRLGMIQSSESNFGAGTYFRLKRATTYTFNDVRLFAHWISNDDTYIKLRYKSSNKFTSLNKFYKFTLVSFDQNKKVGLNIRSQGSQGIGYFLFDYPYWHINTELAFAYDIMDHLNDTQKTSYVKMGIFWDNDFPLLQSKLELDAIFQISDVVSDNELSRFELLIELYYPITRHINLIAGYEMENYFKTKDGSSFFLSLGFKNPLNWKL